MTKEEYWLNNLSEECAELQQAISKAMRFGLDNHHPMRPETNREEILNEYLDVLAVVQILLANTTIPIIDNDFINARIYQKIKKFKKYMRLSEHLGIIQSTGNKRSNVMKRGAEAPEGSSELHTDEN